MQVERSLNDIRDSARDIQAAYLHWPEACNLYAFRQHRSGRLKIHHWKMTGLTF